MGSFGCCFIWFVAGLLLGWLLNYWLSKRCNKKSKDAVNDQTAAPIAKADSIPAATVKATTATSVKKASKPKATATKADVTKSPVDLVAAKAAGISIKSADDLTVIEGIGPKINDLFKENGLKTLGQVGASNVKEMRGILDKGGSRYRMANPSTWAKQAKLAANNKWTALKKLQDELSGGKRK